MAKKGTFGGSRFGGPGYGKTGFKRGFGRSGFGRKGGDFGDGIEKQLMEFFKGMQGGKFDEKTGQFIPPTKPGSPGQDNRGPKRPRQIPKEPVYTIDPIIPVEAAPTDPTTGKKGTPKKNKPKFRPKLTKGAR